MNLIYIIEVNVAVSHIIGYKACASFMYIIVVIDAILKL